MFRVYALSLIHTCLLAKTVSGPLVTVGPPSKLTVPPGGAGAAVTEVMSI